MRSIRQFCAAFALTLLLSLSAFAGDMQFPGATATPTPQQSSVAVPGDMQFPGVTSSGDMSGPGAMAVDPLTEVALTLLTTMFSVF